MNIRSNLIAGFIGLTHFVFAAGTPPAHAEDDANNVNSLKVGVPIRRPSL